MARPKKQAIQNMGAISDFFLRIAPFVLPAILFKSAIMAFISPLPLFIISLKNHSWVSVIALITNASLVYSLGARAEISVAIGYWALVGIIFPVLIRKTGKIQLSFGLALGVAIAGIIAGLLFLSQQTHLSPIEYVRSEFSLILDQLTAMPNSPFKELIEKQGREAVFNERLKDIPSGVVITLIIALWLNLLFASRFIGGFLKPKFWASYRNPEWLVWPTLASGAIYIFADGTPNWISLNFLKIFMTFYGLQGLSILSHLLNRYKIFGLGRAILLSIALLIAMPAVMSLGFFDLWFDFRKKFGHP